MSSRFRALVIALLVIDPSIASDWPQFRGPTGDGVSQATNVPIHWSPSEHVVWKQAIPGTGWSSPVLFRGKLYLTSAVDAGTDSVSLRALCLDAADGRIVGDVEVLRPEPSATKEIHTKNSLASSTPIVDADRLYVHFGHMGTAALDLDGNVLWRQTTLDYQPVHGNGGSPVVFGDKLVFSCDGAQDPFLAALDRASGEVRWKRARDTTATKTFSFSTPTVIEMDGAPQIISVGSGLVGAYDPQDGREIWRVTFEEGYSVVPRPVSAHGLVFISTGFNWPRLMAIDPKGALGDATKTHVLWSHDKGAPLTTSMLVVGDELYFVSDNGVTSCLDARTGRVHWTKRLGGDFSASPVFAEGRIYFPNEAGVTYVVKAGTTFELLATNDLQERTLASPAVTNNAIFLRSELYLWRIGS
ncbi:MAG: PQQ-binding-like beta-propeller repeat protein [Pirellulales bacterium]